MVRAIAGIVVGLAAGMAVMMLVEWFGGQIYPTPDGFNFEDRAALGAYMDAVPMGAKLIVIGGWALASFTGAAVALLIARRGRWPAAVIALLLLGAGIANFLMLPHPMWMIAAGVLALTMPAWFAALAFARTKAA